VLVLSNREFNARSDAFIVCGITADLSNEAYSILIDKSDLARGRLPAPSRIKVSRVATLLQSLAVHTVGHLKPEALARARKELFALL